MCNKCGNINKNINQTNYTSYSSSNLPFIFPFEYAFPPFSPVNNNSGGNNNSYMINSSDDLNTYQNDKNLFSKNEKKKKIKKNKNQKYKDRRPLDWICNRCNNLNYSFRNECNICKLPREENNFYHSNMRNSK